MACDPVPVVNSVVTGLSVIVAGVSVWTTYRIQKRAADDNRTLKQYEVTFLEKRKAYAEICSDVFLLYKLLERLAKCSEWLTMKPGQSEFQEDEGTPMAPAEVEQWRGEITQLYHRMRFSAYGLAPFLDSATRRWVYNMILMIRDEALFVVDFPLGGTYRAGEVTKRYATFQGFCEDLLPKLFGDLAPEAAVRR